MDMDMGSGHVLWIWDLDVDLWIRDLDMLQHVCNISRKSGTSLQATSLHLTQGEGYTQPVCMTHTHTHQSQATDALNSRMLQL